MPAGVRDGVEAFAFTTTERRPNGTGEEESSVQALLTSPADFCRRMGSNFPILRGINWKSKALRRFVPKGGFDRKWKCPLLGSN